MKWLFNMLRKHPLVLGVVSLLTLFLFYNELPERAEISFDLEMADPKALAIAALTFIFSIVGAAKAVMCLFKKQVAAAMIAATLSILLLVSTKRLLSFAYETAFHLPIVMLLGLGIAGLVLCCVIFLMKYALVGHIHNPVVPTKAVYNQHSVRPVTTVTNVSMPMTEVSNIYDREIRNIYSKAGPRLHERYIL